MFVPEGFSGWWCERCVKPVTLPEELGSPARCPRCHKPTAVWVPQVNAECRMQNADTEHRPRAARGRELFEHMRAVADNPELNPDLRQIETEEYQR